MVNIAPWKVYLTVFVIVVSFFYALPNVIGENARGWVSENLPSWAPQNTVNLGLDLRGGAHLLYEVDVESVVRERMDALVSDLRRELRSERIGYTRLGKTAEGIRFTVNEAQDLSEARRVVRELNNQLEISQEGSDTLVATVTEAEIREINTQTLSQSIEIVRRRVDELGTTEPVIQRQGEDRLLVQAPGTDADDLKAVIGTTAQLTFHLVKEPGAPGASRSYPFAEEPGRTLEVHRRAIITGDMLENAQPTFDQTGQPVISFRFNNAGSRRFCDVTRDNVGKPFAIVLDSEVLSAPVIREAICGGQGQISGGFSVEEANNLALLLRAGALPAPMKVVEERTVGPSLGADSIEAGQKASLIGLAAVLVFMILTYSVFGVFASIALFINVVLIFALLSILQATLTLPGIAGIVLTVGMAVDANVLIFERMKEEFKKGRSLIASIDAGYSQAMSTIVDSNLTTLIAAFILFSFGTGPIKGFSVTLGIGIITSFFSAIMITRLMVVLWLRYLKPKVLAF